MQTESATVDQGGLVNPTLAKILVNMDKVFRDIDNLDDILSQQFTDNPNSNPYQRDFREASNNAGVVLMHIENLISIDIKNRVNNSSKQSN